MAHSKPANRRNSRPKGEASIHEAQDDPHRLATRYLRTRGLDAPAGWCLRYWREDFWVWDGTRYRTVPESDLRAEVTSFAKRELNRSASAVRKKAKKQQTVIVVKVTTALISNVLQALKGLVLIPTHIEQPTWVGRSSRGRGPVLAMANGLVDLEGLLSGKPNVVRAHSSDWFSSVSCGYRFDPSARCPRFLAFLAQMFEADSERIALVQEWFGYCLTHDVSFHRCLILVGPGANGKSVLLAILIAVLGEANVSHVPLELFGERFQLTETLGRLANVVAEVGRMDRVAEGLLKQFVSGDPMHFDRKHKSPITARPTARLTLATNTLPPFADPSHGLWRRLMLLPCSVTVPPDQQDRDLTSTLKTELPGIFNWGIEGLRRLRANGCFTTPQVSQQALEEYRNEVNPARAFLKDFVEARPGARTPCATLYQEYRTWCGEGKYEVLNERQFGKEVARIFPAARRFRPTGPGGTRPWTYEGIQVLHSRPGGSTVPAWPVVGRPSRARGLSS